MIKFNAQYFGLAIFLLLIEVLIAIFLDDRFIRPFVGDVLVVILIYCLIKAFWQICSNTAIALVFAFACMVEGLQYLNIVDRLGLRGNPLFSTVIGTTFDAKDILAYAIGAALVFIAEHRRLSHDR
jgi:hypothetical protein